MAAANISYNSVPTAGRFQSDTSITFAIRSEDRILKHLDWLLDRYEKANRANDYSKRRVILCDLFQTANYWIKSYHERNPRMKKERYPGVSALFEAAVATLALLLGCRRPEVSRVIEEIYGRDMHTHGLQVDELQELAAYFTKAERQIYRLRFKGGLAYQYKWWENNPPPRLFPADSSKAYSAIVRKAEGGAKVEGSVNFGGFIMTLERELYMAKHWVGDPHGRNGVFHSSYTAGERVIMAGTMKIQGGVIEAIRSDSGHYQPTEMNMAALLQGLGMFGVNLPRIQLRDFKDNPVGNALDFLKSHLSWDQYVKQRENERKHRVESDDYRKAHGSDVHFPQLRPQQQPEVYANANREGLYN